MTIESATKANVKQVVPFLGVTNMEASLRFYVDGLGFEMKRWWIPDDEDGDYMTFVYLKIRSEFLGLSPYAEFPAEDTGRPLRASHRK